MVRLCKWLRIATSTRLLSIHFPIIWLSFLVLNTSVLVSLNLENILKNLTPSNVKEDLKESISWLSAACPRRAMYRPKLYRKITKKIMIKRGIYPLWSRVHGDQTVHLRGKIIGWARMRAASEPVPVLSVIEVDCCSCSGCLFIHWFGVSEWTFTAISKSIWYWRGRNARPGTPGGIYQVSIFDSLSNVSSLRQIRNLIPRIHVCYFVI